jgi:hypothetical protein
MVGEDTKEEEKKKEEKTYGPIPESAFAGSHDPEFPRVP